MHTPSRRTITQSAAALLTTLALTAGPLAVAPPASAAEPLDVKVTVTGDRVRIAVANSSTRPMTRCALGVVDDWGYPVWIASSGNQSIAAGHTFRSTSPSAWEKGYYVGVAYCDEDSDEEWFTVLTPPFRDVQKGDPFHQEITWLSASDISTGYPDGTYRPLNTVNRDAMAAFLYRMAGKPPFTPPARSPFRDIAPSTAFYKEMTWLASEGITTGYPDGTYRPLTPVNRDAMAAFLYRFHEVASHVPPSTSPFRDVTPGTQFYKEMTWMHAEYISTGYPDGTYRPLEPVKRDAMAAFLFRLQLLRAEESRGQGHVATLPALRR